MKDLKRRMELYSLYDRSGMEEHLAQMAEQGWLLEKIGAYLWTYRRIEPKRLTFSVCYFPKASQFDPAPSEEQETFYDFCAHTGWVLAAANAQLQVFYNERPHPVPIETDPVAEVEAFRKDMKKRFLPLCAILLGLGLFYLWYAFSQLRADLIGALSSVTWLFTVFSWAMVLLLTIRGIAGCLLRLRRARRAAERGEFWEPRRRKGSQRLHTAVMAVPFAGYLLSILTSGDRLTMAAALLVFGLYIPAVMLISQGVRRYLKKDGVPAGYSRGITMVITVLVSLVLLRGITAFTNYGYIHGWFGEDNVVTYEYQGKTYALGRDPAPLTLEDLLEGDFSHYSIRWRESQSPLLGQYTGNQWPIGPVELFPEEFYLDYEVVLVKVPALYGLCRETKLHERDGWGDRNPVWQGYAYAPTDPTPWGAEEAYQWTRGDGADSIRGGHQFLLFYPERVVEISLQWEQAPTPEQMALVGEKLGKG